MGMGDFLHALPVRGEASLGSLPERIVVAAIRARDVDVALPSDRPYRSAVRDESAGNRFGGSHGRRLGRLPRATADARSEQGDENDRLLHHDLRRFLAGHSSSGRAMTSVMKSLESFA
jgi:hypothetical protein